MFSLIFIRRPILATVCSIIIVLAGLVSMYALPISQFPQLIPPQVSVSATYTGATPEVIAQVVAAPIEAQVNGVEDMIYMNSVSDSQGNMTLTVTFELGTDPDQATINVNNRVQMAMPQLPTDVRKNAVTVTKTSPNLLMIFTLLSKEGVYDEIYLSNYGLLNISDAVKRIPGVSDVKNYANKDYAIRIWLKPDKMAQLDLSPQEIANVIEDQNSQYAVGSIGDQPTKSNPEKSYILTTKGRFTTPEEFENIIITSKPDGQTVYLKDIAEVQLGSKIYSFSSTQDGLACVPFAVMLTTDANAIEVCDQVRAYLKEAQKSFPRGLEYDIPYDTTTFVRVSIDEVIKTFVEALILVFLVVLLFLQNFRATLIPCLAVPVSIIGTFAGLKAFNFSINTLTLFGLVLAIGLVVDDAIVVIENVDRHMEEGMSPYDATCKAMMEVTSPVIAIVLVLCSVFIPVAFLGGLTGVLYKQFAITISISIVISGFVALSLTPALCAILLKPQTHAPKFFLFRWFNAFFDKITHAFSSTVSLMLKHTLIVLAVFALFIAATVKFAGVVPTALVPNEDQGLITVSTVLPDGTAQNQTADFMDRFSKICEKIPETESVLIFSGYSVIASAYLSNYGTAHITLKDWKERTNPGQDSFTLAKKIMGDTWNLPEGQVYAFNPPAIIGMSTTGGVEGYLQSRNTTDVNEINRVTQLFIEEAQKRPELSNVSTTFSVSVPQYYVNVDRVKLRSLGVTLSDLFNTMNNIFSSYYVNDFDKAGRTFEVLVSSKPMYRDYKDATKYTYVRADNGTMIPLDSLIDLRPITGPGMMTRFNVFPAAQLTAEPAAGYTSGQAIAAMEEVASTMPEGYYLEWTGTAYQENKTGSTTTVAFLLGIIMVFLILAAQYEMWSLPFAVVLSIPFALFGAFLATLLRGLANDLYFQVALVTLIGLSAKNAILIVEFAIDEYRAGKPLLEAAIDAAHLRFRPIVMTSLAFILGVLPLAVSTGAGAASRHSIGTGIIGGMTASTAIGVFFVPCFFVLVMKLSMRKGKEEVRNAGNTSEGEVK